MSKNNVEIGAEHLAIIRQSKIFQNVAERGIRDFLRSSRIVNYADGSVIITEGDITQSLFIILEGEVGVYKQDKDSGEDILFTTLGEGDEFGELSLIIKQERSASVRAQGDVVVLIVSTDLSATTQPLKLLNTYSILMRNLARELGRKLIATDEVTVQHLKTELELARTQSAMAEFIVFITAVMTLFSFTLAILNAASDNLALLDTFSNVATGIAVLAFMVLIIRSPYKLDTFGINLPENLLQHVMSALAWSAGLIVIATLAKWIVIQTVPAFNDFPLLFLPGEDYPGFEYAVSKLTLTLTLGYVVLSILQELMVRGVIQGSLVMFFKDWKYKYALAILLSNGMFAAGHLYLSPTFAVITFFTGCFWGLQYIQKPSIIGVWISHTLVGLYGLRILGVLAMIRMIEI